MLGVAASLPLLLVAVLPSHAAVLVCRFTGAMVQAETCCPVEERGSSGPRAHLRDEACCSMRALDRPALVSENRSEARPARRHQLGVVWLANPAPPPALRVAGIRHLALPFRPPPIALKHSLLI
jgi:hypothetical protein